MAENYNFLRTFTFDGNETNHLFQIAKVNIPFLSKDNEFYTVGNTDARHFRSTRLGDYTLSIDGFVIKDNTGMSVSDSLDELKVLLNSDEPKQLVFDIFPDRYFNAIFSGVQEYDATNLDYTPLTLVFDVPDGLAHSIEPIGFSNTNSTTTNLMLDSEYNATYKYMKPWVEKLDEKFNNSNVVQGDFRTGIPLNFERDDKTDERWLNWNPATTIHTTDLKVGDEVNFSVYAQVLSIDEENNKDYAGQVILEEWDTVKGAILKRHIVYIPKKVTTEFTKYGSVVKIENEKTNAINLQYGFRGSNLIKWSKPMVSFLPPIGATVTAPSVGAKAYSNSLDFGNYDYSTVPNLLYTITKSSWSNWVSSVIAPKNYVKVFDDYIIIDATDPSAANVGRNVYIPNITRLTKGKQYTLSVTMMVDNEFDLSESAYTQAAVHYTVQSNGAPERPMVMRPNKTMVNQWQRVSVKFTVPTSIKDGEDCFLHFYEGSQVQGKWYIRNDIMIQEGDQTSSQAPANQMPKTTTDKWYAISDVERTEEAGNITSFKYPAKTGINKIAYLQNDKNLIPLLSDKKQYTLSAEVWLEKEVNAPVVYRVNDGNGTAKVLMVANTVNVPAKQWTKVSTTQTINLPSNPNLISKLGFDDWDLMGKNITKSDEGTHISFDFSNNVTDMNVYAGFKKSLPQLVAGKKYTLTAEISTSESWEGRIRMSYRVNKLDGTGKGTLLGDVNNPQANQWYTLTTYPEHHVMTDDMNDFKSAWLQMNLSNTLFKGKVNIRYTVKIEEGETYTPDYPAHWVQLNAPESYEGTIKIKNDSIKIQEGATTTKPAWKPNLLAEPYEVGDVPVQPNIANRDIQFPIKTSEYLSYKANMIEPFVVGETYTITLKGTKPASQRFVAYNDGNIDFGNLKPVEGLTDVWSLTFTPTKVASNVPKEFRVYQYPPSTAGACQIYWIKIEKGDARTPNIPYYKYEGIAPAPSNNPKDYHWGYSPSYINAVEYVPSGDSVGDLIKVENNGTYKAYPQINFTMKGENGLVAVLNENGNVLQFGNPEDVDGTIATRLDMGLKENFWGNTLPTNITINSGFDSVVPNFNNNPATPNLFDGGFDMTTYADAIRPTFPQVTKEVWHGPSMILPITAPTNNSRAGSFGVHTRFYFRNINKGERGRLEFAVNDETGANAMTFIVRDSSITNTEIVLEMWYKKKKLNQVSLDRKVFKKDFFEVNMERTGKQLTWRFVQINSLNKYDNVIVDKQYKFIWNLEEDDATKFTSTGVWFMRYGNTPHNPMYVTDMQVKWYNTPFFNNVKNIFQDGDNVTIDVEERAIYINGTINNELNIVGNEWEQFRLGLGTTIIQPVVSSWAQPANVSVTFRQSYL